VSDQFKDAWAYGEPLQPCLNRLTTAAGKAKLRDAWLTAKDIDTVASYRPSGIDIAGGEVR
jgi:hypothetical protein